MKALFANSGIPVLMYHGIANGELPTDAHRVHVTKRAFEAQMAWLFEHQYRSVSVSSLLTGQLEDKTFILSFDDGFKSQVEIAAPILARYGYTATTFLVTDWLSKSAQGKELAADMLPEDSIMEWEDARLLKAFGWEIGSHTASHIDCTGVSKDVLQEELLKSKNAIEAELGIIPQVFAYPFGRYNETALSEVKKSYTAAVSVHDGLSSLVEELRYRQHRVEINKYDTVQSFQQKILTGYGSSAKRVRGKFRDALYKSVVLKDSLAQFVK